MSKKAVTTLDIISSIFSFLKTASVVIIMMVLQRSRQRELAADISEQKAKDDLKIEKLKNDLGQKTDEQIIKEYLDRSDDIL